LQAGQSLALMSGKENQPAAALKSAGRLPLSGRVAA